jgi:toxin CcdB
MAQYDVFENPSIAQRGGYPYLVVLQNDQLENYKTRLVMPLARLPSAPRALPRRLAQSVVIAGETVFLAAHLCAPLPAALLKKPIASLREQAGALRDALDAVMSGV